MIRWNTRQTKTPILRFRRTFVRSGGDRHGRPIFKELAKPKNLEYWQPKKRMMIRWTIMADAASLLDCPQDSVILMDTGKEITCWEDGGKYADVVTYTRYR